MQKSETRPRLAAPRTKRPSPTWVLPIPHSLILSLPPEAPRILFSPVGHRGLTCFGIFLVSGGRRNSNLPRPPLYLYSLRENPTSKGFFRFELRFIFAFHPVSSLKTG